MRGSCSPLSMSTIRVAPMRLRSVTRPAGASSTVPIAHAPALTSCAPQDVECAFGVARPARMRRSVLRWRRTAGRSPRISHAPRTSSRTGMSASRTCDVQPRRLGDLDERARQAAAGQVAQAVDLDAGRRAAPHRLRQRRAVAFDGRLEREPLAHRHDRHAVPADVAAQQHRVARPDAARARSARSCSTMPMPAVLMKMPSPLPRSTTFVSPVTSCTPAAARPPLHRRDDAPQRLHRQPLFEDEARAQIERPRAAHRQVVDRAVDRQRADVAARERTAAGRRRSRS